MNNGIIAILVFTLAFLTSPQDFFEKVPEKASFESLCDSPDYAVVNSLEDEILFLINRHRDELSRDAQKEDIDFSKAEKIYRINDLAVFKEKPSYLIEDFLQKEDYIWRLPVNVGNRTVEVCLSRAEKTQLSAESCKNGSWVVSSVNLTPVRPFFKDSARSILMANERSPRCYSVILTQNNALGTAAICFWGGSANYFIPFNDIPGKKVFNADIMNYSDAVLLISPNHYKSFLKKVELQAKTDNEKLDIPSQGFKITAVGLSLLILVFWTAKKRINSIEK